MRKYATKVYGLQEKAKHGSKLMDAVTRSLATNMGKYISENIGPHLTIEHQGQMHEGKPVTRYQAMVNVLPETHERAIIEQLAFLKGGEDVPAQRANDIRNRIIGILLMELKTPEQVEQEILAQKAAAEQPAEDPGEGPGLIAMSRGESLLPE